MKNIVKDQKEKAKSEKCGHPPCSCTVAPGTRYCSAECESMGTSPDIECKCGHSGCKGNIA